MKKIYIDNDFKCHTTNPDGTFRDMETELFDGKCAAYIEGYRYIPAGESWERHDGVVFHSEMVAPWKDWRELDDAQRQYERELLAQHEQALSEIEQALGVTA